MVLLNAGFVIGMIACVFGQEWGGMLAVGCAIAAMIRLGWEYR